MSPQGSTVTELMRAPLSMVALTAPNGVKSKPLVPFVGGWGLEVQQDGLGCIMGIETLVLIGIKYIDKMVAIEVFGNIALNAAQRRLK